MLLEHVTNTNSFNLMVLIFAAVGRFNWSWIQKYLKLFSIQANLYILICTVNSKIVSIVQKLLREVLSARLS